LQRSALLVSVAHRLSLIGRPSNKMWDPIDYVGNPTKALDVVHEAMSNDVPTAPSCSGSARGYPYDRCEERAERLHEMVEVSLNQAQTRHYARVSDQPRPDEAHWQFLRQQQIVLKKTIQQDGDWPPSGARG
jgi:hypothetical protein